MLLTQGGSTKSTTDSLSNKLLYGFGLVIFFLSIAYYCLSLYADVENVIQFFSYSEYIQIPQNIGTFSLPFFETKVSFHPKWIWKTFGASNFTFRQEHVWMYWGFVWIALSLLFVALQEMQKWMFWVCTAAMIAFIYMGNLNFLHTPIENPSIEDPYQYFASSLIILLFGLVLVYKFIWKSAPSFVRWISFLVFSGGAIWYLQTQYTVISHSALWVAAETQSLVALLIFVFIVYNSHEIVHLFLWASTITPFGGKQNLFSFIGLTAVYLLLLFSTILIEIANLSEEWPYINVFYLLPFTAIIGLWGFKKRRETYAEYMSYSASGKFLFLALGILTFSMLGFSFGVFNSPILSVFKQIILYSHFSYGLVFMGYVVMYFLKYLESGAAVHKIVWSTQEISYHSISMVAFILLFVFFGRLEFFVFSQMKAARYHLEGDMYLSEGYTDLAKTLYEHAWKSDRMNYRSNYTLASLARAEGKRDEAMRYFDNCRTFKNYPFEYLALSAFEMERKNPFLSLQILKEGEERFPESVEILLNLSEIYMKMDSLEACKITLDKALLLQPENPYVHANVYTLAHLQNTGISMYEPISEISYPNILGHSSFSDQPYAHLDLLSDSVLNEYDISHIHHLAGYYGKEADSSFIQRLEGLIRMPINLRYDEELLWDRALVLFQKKKYREALQQLEDLSEVNKTSNPEVYMLQGVLLSEVGQFSEAGSAFLKALNLTKFEASYARAYVLSLDSSPESKQEAIRLWNAWDTIPSHPYQGLAHDMLQVLSKKETPSGLRQEILYAMTMGHLPEPDKLAQWMQEAPKETAALTKILAIKGKQTMDAQAYLAFADNVLNIGVPVEASNFWKKEKAQVFAAHKKWEELSTLAKENSSIHSMSEFLELSQLMMKGDTSINNKLAVYSQLQSYFPYETWTYLQPLEDLWNTGRLEQAYELSLSAKQTIKNVPSYEYAYMKSSLLLKYWGFAEKSLKSLEFISSEADFKQYKYLYDSLYQENLKEEAAWMGYDPSEISDTEEESIE